jgi:enoyl-CoA hydratase/3-hydroxyacyl-CoA dehydrogenase
VEPCTLTRVSVWGSRGGLIFWADLVGAKHIAARLNQWATQFEGAGIAGFFKPCEYLARAAAAGTPLSAGVQGSPKL